MQDFKEIKPSCREVSAYAHLHVEGELDPLRTARLEAHLESCASCRQSVEELSDERLWIMESAISTPRLPARFATRVTDEIRKERERRSLGRWFRAACAALSVTGAAAVALLAVNLLPVGETPSVRDGVVSRKGGGPRSERLAIEEGRDTEEGRGAGETAARVLAAGLGTGPGREMPRAATSSEPANFEARFARLERGCSDLDEEQHDEVDPLFPSTALVCATCADPEAILSGTLAESEPGRAAGTERPRFRDAIILAFELENGETSPTKETSLSADPCFRDPNADGRRDGSDVALYLQQALASDILPGEAAVAALEAAMAEDRPCEEICVGA